VTAELNEASARAEDINRAIKTLENKNMIDEGSKETKKTMGKKYCKSYFLSHIV
jgi:cell division protein FtsB